MRFVGPKMVQFEQKIGFFPYLSQNGQINLKA